MDLDKVKLTIRGLLNLANDDAAAENEVDTAMRFANKLMEQHQLSEEDVKENKTEDIIIGLERATMVELAGWMGGNKYCHWEAEAASFACAFVGGVKWFYNENVLYKVNNIVQFHTGKWKHQAQTRTKVTFYGIEEDVQLAFTVYNELLMTVASMAKLKWGGVYRGPGRNYCEGFIDGLFGKFHDDQNKQKLLAKTSAGTALMVIDNRQLVIQKKNELVEAWIKKARPKLREVSRQKAGSYDHEARQDGRADGQRYTSGATKAVKKPKLADLR